jgi:soluble lytic murein transglycosylase-like protein
VVVSKPVLRLFPVRLRCLAALVCVAAGTAAAHGLERVTLRNGFTIDCAWHEPVDGRVRVYLDANGTSYQDLPASSIAAIEPLPDPAPVAAAPASSPAAAAASNSNVRDLLARAGAQHNIDVELLASVVKAESGGHADAVSRAGARGLMQLMPATAHALGVQDVFQPDQNIAGGAAYLDSLLKRYKNDLNLALAAYNAGPGAVDRYHGVPPFRETRAYVVRVENEFIRRKQAAARAAAMAVVSPH